MKARYWVLHYISGGILFILLLGHIFMMHFYKFLSKILGTFVVEPLEWEAVVERAKNLTLEVLYILFLLFALFHGLYGLKNILIETKIGKKLEKPITIFLFIVGVLFFLFGTYTTIKAGGVR